MTFEERVDAVLNEAGFWSLLTDREPDSLSFIVDKSGHHGYSEMKPDGMPGKIVRKPKKRRKTNA